ncbi:MAG: hypothetical protein IIA67_07500 [Planctomycetes bacterium]|nr:hypothetical protein [Planctomycetota bacterium]
MNKLHRAAPVWIAVVLGVTAASWACSTPVYRYAMYRWQRAPYEVFYLHQGETPPQDAAVNKSLAALSSNGPAEGKSANVRFTSLDISDKAVLASLPPELQATLKKHKDKPLPWHVIYTPGWTELHVGRLDEKSTKTLADSPARKKMNKLLSDGAPCVLVLVPGKDEAVNKSAREHIATTIKNAAQGKFTPPEDPLEATLGQPPAGPGGGKPAKAKKKTKLPDVATITVKRDDSQEQWLLRCLMQAEGDLGKFKDEAMVFAVYGRARVMPPCIGKGITPQNLGDYVVFSMGPCSCEVKDQNPGMDLLSQWDWKKSATALAELFGNETGNETLLQTDDFLRLLVTPPSNFDTEKDAKPKVKDEPKGGAARTKPFDVEQSDTQLADIQPTGSQPTVTQPTVTQPTGLKPSIAKPEELVAAKPAVESAEAKNEGAEKPSTEKLYADASDAAPLVKAGPIPSANRRDDGGARMPAWRVLRNLAFASTAAVAALLVVGFLFLRPRSA